MIKSFTNNKIVTICFYICLNMAALYIAYTFRLNLLLDLFWEKTDQVAIGKAADDLGQLAGLPAGEDVTRLTDLDQFYSLQMTDYISVKPDYITFETDSIIPLGVYHRNSEMDAHTTSYWSGGSYHSADIFRPKYTDSKIAGASFMYNQYYLVGLPDGNYVPALLDDACYIKYRLTGKVKLPVGVADHMYINPEQRLRLQPFLDEYGLDNERILIMFCGKRYEDWILLYAGVAFLLYCMILIAGIFIKEIIKK